GYHCQNELSRHVSGGRMDKPQDVPSVVISEDDYRRLAFMATLSRMGRRQPPTGALLADELDRARVVPGEDVPESVVTMGSTVEFRDHDTGGATEVTIVYPGEEGSAPGRLSVLTPLGTA